MSKKKVPTLSAAGFVSEIAGKLDNLMVYFFTSEYSQTNIYAEQITSLQYIVQQHGNDPLQLRMLIKSSLDKYLGRHFDTVSVDAYTNVGEGNADTARFTLTIDVDVAENGNTYSLGKEISVINSKISNLVDKLNG